MKMLKGSLRETLFTTPALEGQKPLPFKVSEYHENESTYISDNIGLHKIENASETEIAVSLHLYTPPHAHNFGFNLFDERSGKKCHITKAPLFSEHGKICDSKIKASSVKTCYQAERVDVGIVGNHIVSH